MVISFEANGNDKQFEAWEYWSDNTTEQILYGGAKYGGKSYLGCSLIFADALMYPNTMYFIARENLNDLRKFTTPSIYEVFINWGLNPMDYIKYNGHDNLFTLYNGSKVFLLEAKHLPSDPDFHRFGSIQMTRGWCEEIGQMSDKAINMLWLTVGRWKNAEYGLKKKFLLTCNPHKGYGYTEFYLPNKNGNLPLSRKFISALPQDNKSGDQDYIQSILTNPDKSQRERLGFGNWEYDDDPSTLVEYDNILSMFDREVAGGNMVITADIALQGSDRFIVMVWSGHQVIDIQVMGKSDGSEVITLIENMAKKYGVQRSRIIFDSDGVGAMLEGILKGARAFKNGSSPIGKENYMHLKDQCGYALAQRINDGKIGISDHKYKGEIIREVEQLKSYKVDDDRKLRILPKKEIKKLLGHSPDFLDCLIMRQYIEVGGSGGGKSRLITV